MHGVVPSDFCPPQVQALRVKELASDFAHGRCKYAKSASCPEKGETPHLISPNMVAN